MKNKRTVIGLITIFIISFGWIIGNCFIERTDVYLKDYTVSADGDEITLQVGIAGSLGYTRGFKEKLTAEKPFYMTFYATFGGFNCSIGKKDEFILKLYPTTTEIFFYHGGQGYELVLHKNKTTGKWERP